MNTDFSPRGFPYNRPGHTPEDPVNATGNTPGLPRPGYRQ